MAYWVDLESAEQKRVQRSQRLRFCAEGVDFRESQGTEESVVSKPNVHHTAQSNSQKISGSLFAVFNLLVGGEQDRHFPPSLARDQKHTSHQEPVNLHRTRAFQFQFRCLS